VTRYVATHADPLTTVIRRTRWYPQRQYGCGCESARLCQQHSAIRAAEHYDPTLIPEDAR